MKAPGRTDRPWMRAPIPLLLLLASILIMSASCITHPQDVSALIALHTAWSQRPSSWDASTDPCDDAWLGVRCDNATNTRVVQLLLINQDLTGTLPSAIGDLTNLTDLDLSSNPNLGGTLPKEIGKLTNIGKFFVQFCNFSGSIPSEIGNLTNVHHFGLTGNNFSGALPSNIGLMKNMFWLDISSNHLNGSLPVSDYANGISGLDNLTLAHHFHFDNNEFSGSIPPTLFHTDMQLAHLLLYNNNFSGNIPLSIGNLTSVEIIRLDSNNLNGPIPSSLNTIANLTTLQVNNNKLTGSLPDLTDSSNKSKLQMLNLGYNDYDTSEIPVWITNLTSLYLLALDSANLVGNISAALFLSSQNLLSNVTLVSNRLNGTLDLTLAGTNLSLVNLTNNNITGVSKGNYIQELLLDGNPYCNSNPTECMALQSNTSIAAPPASSATSTCTNTCPAEYAVNRKTSGCQCARPVQGSITFLATKIPLLTDFNISVMEDIFSVGLSIALNIIILETQVVVNVLSATQLRVSVFPPNSQDAWHPNDATRIAYTLKNQEIEFPSIGPLICGFFGSPYNNVVVAKGLNTGAKVGIGIAVAVLVITIIFIALYAMKQKKRAEKAEYLNKPFAAWIAASEGPNPDIPQLKGARWFSLQEITKCTNSFSKSNEIGEGGYGKVYKGYLLSGEQVAIKRAGTDSLQGAEEFKNEIELLSRVHHRNLVGLIGFCFEEGEQMLVYQYMPNGTLMECLSGKTGLQMDWERRIALALDSARGIAYLHTAANPPIVHRDIKSSNILLDGKLVAKVADFGLCKLAPNGDDIFSFSTQVKGTMGYLDPDYFMTNQFTDKSDVYSFGVVLLELVTGRLPIQEGKYLVREMKIAVRQGGMTSARKAMVDPNLTDYPSMAVERLMTLALRCLEDNPTARPTMSDVVKELEFLAQEEMAPMYIDMDMDQERAELYENLAPYMQQQNYSSFEYSGSYSGMNNTNARA